MLEYCTLSFKIETISWSHVGDGGMVAIDELCVGLTGRQQHLKVFKKNAKEADGQVLTVSRGAEGVPVIEATGLRGALRTLLENELAKSLFGPQDMDDGHEAKTSDAGKLWLFGGLAVGDPPTDCGSLPFWDAEKKTFILTAHARNRDLNAVEDEKLYNIEVVPAGVSFEFSGVYRGSRQEFECDLLPLLRETASDDGFRIGGSKGYGFGLAKLVAGSVEGKHTKYQTESCQFSEPEKFAFKIETAVGNPPTCVFKLTCDGPFLILDPLRKVAEDDPNWRSLEMLDNKPILTGKAVLQALRAVSARLESEEFIAAHGFDYDHPARPIDDPSALYTLGGPLTLTQRLFGVTGWQKLFGVHRVEPDWTIIEEYEGQGIQLDAFTQGPIDGALLTFTVPTGMAATVTFRLDEKRCGGQKTELVRHLKATIVRAKVEGLMLGHSVSTGFGWFAMEDL